MSATVQSLTNRGSSGVLVDIECHLSNNLPNIVIVGLAGQAVAEAKERIRSAFADSHIMLPRKRITVNLAPADVPKADSGFDLAIAISILRAGQQVPTDNGTRPAFIGELGLDGGVRAVRGIIGKLLTGREKGITTFYIPAANLRQALLVPKITLYPLESLRQLFHHLTGAATSLRAIGTADGSYDTAEDTVAGWAPAVTLSEVVGQAQAKRALEIAAAGGHNVFFSGPPGTGKSMLAKALPSILPPLTQEEMLDVTHIHSLATNDYDRVTSRRPFRAPHHSASYVAITGGGSNLRPGEISLAHRGVLFLDELPEFSRTTLETLRQPLEDRVISIARAKNNAEYPADFILVATANPCPCGYYGTREDCRCLPGQILRYQQRLSGPILDRIDLYSNVHEIKHATLLKQQRDAVADEQIRRRVQDARSRQANRYEQDRCSGKLNASASNHQVKQYGRPTTEAEALLNAAARRLHISARAYMRCVKVARTIADLDSSEVITTAHISEALAYRAPRNKE